MEGQLTRPQDVAWTGKLSILGRQNSDRGIGIVRVHDFKVDIYDVRPRALRN